MDVVEQTLKTLNSTIHEILMKSKDSNPIRKCDETKTFIELIVKLLEYRIRTFVKFSEFMKKAVMIEEMPIKNLDEYYKTTKIVRKCLNDNCLIEVLQALNRLQNTPNGRELIEEYYHSRSIFSDWGTLNILCNSLLQIKDIKFQIEPAKKLIIKRRKKSFNRRRGSTMSQASESSDSSTPGLKMISSYKTTSGIKKYQEKRPRARSVSLKGFKKPRMPKILDKLWGYLLEKEKIQQVHQELPELLQDRDWKLVFSTRENEPTMKKLFFELQNAEETLMIIQTKENTKFGAYCPEPWIKCKKQFFGNQDAFLFTFAFSKQIQVYRASGKNENYMYTQDDAIAMGTSAQHNSYGLYIKDDFKAGYTRSSETFSSYPLNQNQHFEIETVEFWKFPPPTLQVNKNMLSRVHKSSLTELKCDDEDDIEPPEVIEYSQRSSVMDELSDFSIPSQLESDISASLAQSMDNFEKPLPMQASLNDQGEFTYLAIPPRNIGKSNSSPTSGTPSSIQTPVRNKLSSLKINFQNVESPSPSPSIFEKRNLLFNPSQSQQNTKFVVCREKKAGSKPPIIRKIPSTTGTGAYFESINIKAQSMLQMQRDRAALDLKRSRNAFFRKTYIESLEKKTLNEPQYYDTWMTLSKFRSSLSNIKTFFGPQE